MRAPVVLALVVGVLLPLGSARPACQRAQAPAFAAKTTLIPVDVRVVDRAGMPVTDLTQDDFSVFEDGERQVIQHFSPHRLAAEAPSAGTTLRRASDANALDAQNSRTFLLLIGRGYLQPVSKAFDAAIDFVRNDLLPQDRVAVMGWDRATDFTNDHEKIARVLEALRSQDQEIESLLSQYYSGLAALYAGKGNPDAIQNRIDAVFGFAGDPARSVPQGQQADAAQMAADQRDAADARLGAGSTDQMRIGQAQSAGNNLVGAGNVSLASSVGDPIGLAGDSIASFDDYVAHSRQTTQDVGNLYSGIEYLRFVDGEKHLVLFSNNGLFLPRYENDKNLASRASDARVAVDTIQTGGTPITGGFAQGWAIRSMKTISEQSGGQASSYSYAAKALAAINQATSFNYLLGYSPTNQRWNGAYRDIKVTVNRKNVDVFFRHGYYATNRTASLTQAQIMAYTRVTMAVGMSGDVRDIKLATKIDDFKDGDQRGVAIALHVDPSRVSFTTTAAGVHAASFDVAVFCNDPKEDMLVEKLWRTVQLSLPEDEYQRTMKSGIDVNFRAPVDAVPRLVRVIVYDASSDHLGSTFARIR